MNKKKQGFTMIELLVVATIIAVLTAIGVVSFSRANIRARDGKRKADLEQLRSALELYRSDMGQYPAVDSAHLVSTLAAGNLTSTNVSDPKSTDPYTYCASTTSAGACVTAGVTKFYTIQTTLENTSDSQCKSNPCVITVKNP